MQDSTYERYYSKYLTEDEIAQEFLSTGWILPNARFHEEELRASMSRLEIENKFFRAKFFNKIDEIHKDIFLNFEKSRSTIYDPKK